MAHPSAIAVENRCEYEAHLATRDGGFAMRMLK